MEFDGYNPNDIEAYENEANITPYVTLSNVLLGGSDGNPMGYSMTTLKCV